MCHDSTQQKSEPLDFFDWDVCMYVEFMLGVVHPLCDVVPKLPTNADWVLKPYVYCLNLVLSIK